jgi:hypothetical protein
MDDTSASTINTLVESDVLTNNVSAYITRYSFNVDQYHSLAEAGILHHEERVELLCGQVMRMHPTARRLWTLSEYHKMLQIGIIAESERTELAAGEILERATSSASHIRCVERLARLFDGVRQYIEPYTSIGVGKPVLLHERYELKPDLSLVELRGSYDARIYKGPLDIYLIVEVADSTAELERAVRLPLYARAGVLELWLVNLPDEVVDVYTFANPATGTYSYRDRLGRGESITLSAFFPASIEVDAILG